MRGQGVVRTQQSPTASPWFRERGLKLFDSNIWKVNEREDESLLCNMNNLSREGGKASFRKLSTTTDVFIQEAKV